MVVRKGDMGNAKKCYDLYVKFTPDHAPPKFVMLRFNESGSFVTQRTDDANIWDPLPLSFIPTGVFRYPFQYRVILRKGSKKGFVSSDILASLVAPVIIAKEEEGAKKVLHVRHNVTRGGRRTFPIRVIAEDGKAAKLVYAVGSARPSPSPAKNALHNVASSVQDANSAQDEKVSPVIRTISNIEAP